MGGCVYMSVGAMEVRRKLFGVGGCERPNTGAGNWTLVLCKSSKSYNYWAISPALSCISKYLQLLNQLLSSELSLLKACPSEWPTNLISLNRPLLLIAYSAMNSSLINPLIKLMHLWSDLLSTLQPTVDQPSVDESFAENDGLHIYTMREDRKSSWEQKYRIWENQNDLAQSDSQVYSILSCSLPFNSQVPRTQGCSSRTSLRSRSSYLALAFTKSPSFSCPQVCSVFLGRQCCTLH